MKSPWCTACLRADGSNTYFLISRLIVDSDLNRIILIFGHEMVDDWFTDLYTVVAEIFYLRRKIYQNLLYAFLSFFLSFVYTCIRIL